MIQVFCLFCFFVYLGFLSFPWLVEPHSSLWFWLPWFLCSVTRGACSYPACPLETKTSSYIYSFSGLEPFKLLAPAVAKHTLCSIFCTICLFSAFSQTFFPLPFFFVLLGLYLFYSSGVILMGFRREAK